MGTLKLGQKLKSFFMKFYGKLKGLCYVKFSGTLIVHLRVYIIKNSIMYHLNDTCSKHYVRQNIHFIVMRPLL